MRSKRLKKKKGEGYLIESLDLIRLCIFSLVLVYIFITFVLKPVEVIGDSMYPTLINGEKGLSNVFTRLTTPIKRFDVVVVKEPISQDLWVKRVIGLPGDVIEFKNDELFINNKKYQETYLDKSYVNTKKTKNHLFTNNFKSKKLENDEYFLMGDNRSVSLDSRARGPFKESQIICKSVIVLYPFDKFKVIE
ncbi:MAG: signal peptidase I [Erysipelotrichaceae bacterium]